MLISIHDTHFPFCGEVLQDYMDLDVGEIVKNREHVKKVLTSIYDTHWFEGWGDSIQLDGIFRFTTECAIKILSVALIEFINYT